VGYGLWAKAGGAGKISSEPLLNTPFSPFPNKKVGEEKRTKPQTES